MLNCIMLSKKNQSKLRNIKIAKNQKNLNKNRKIKKKIRKMKKRIIIHLKKINKIDLPLF